MSKLDMLMTAKAWLNKGHAYLLKGDINKAESCLAISIRITNTATEN